MADPGRWVVLAALTIARVAFGYQLQAVPSLGPTFVTTFAVDYATLGTLVGLYSAPGILLALPSGLAGGRWGSRIVVVLGLGAMTVGSVMSGLASDPVGIGIGRIVAGAGAVGLMVLLADVVASRFPDRHYYTAMGIAIGAFPVGIGVGQLVQAPLAEAWGWSMVFHSGAVLSFVALVLFWPFARNDRPAAIRRFALPSRHETVLVLLAGGIWATYNAGYFSFLTYLPSLMTVRGYDAATAGLIMAVISWICFPSIVIGGALSSRYGPHGVFMVGMIACAVGIAAFGVVDSPLVLGSLWGLVGTMQAGVIVALAAASTKPENRPVGMGIFYIVYYTGTAVLPPVCGLAADVTGYPGAAMLVAGALAALAIPFYLVHRRVKGAGPGGP